MRIKISLMSLIKARPLLFVFITFLLYACDNSHETIPKNRFDSNLPQAVRLGTTQTPPSWLTHIAEHEGFFKQQGLNVITTHYKSGKLALEGMFNGQVDIATTAIGPIVSHSLNRQDFSIVAKIGTSSNDNVILARRDRGILKPTDMKNKNIATQSDAASNFYLHLFLVTHGIKETDNSLSFIKVGKLPQAIISGKVDAISTREPFVTEAIQGLGQNAIVFETPGLYLKSFQLTSHNTFINDNPQVFAKLLKALLLAEKFVKNNPNKSIDIFSKKFNLKKDHIKSLLKYLDFSIILDQSLITQLEDEARWEIHNRLPEIITIPNYLKFIHPDALREINPKLVTIITMEK